MTDVNTNTSAGTGDTPVVDTVDENATPKMPEEGKEGEAPVEEPASE